MVVMSDAAVAEPGPWVILTPEVTAWVAGESGDATPLPADPLFIVIDPLAHDATQPTLRFEHHVEHIPEGVVCVAVQRAVWLRLGGRAPTHGEFSAFHLLGSLREIAFALREGAVAGRARIAYRLAKSIEFVCETIRQQASGQLVPQGASGPLSYGQSRKVLAARHLIEERWSEKLTLDDIARACNLSRAKLTRGFRDLFDCSVGEALAERRLDQARRMLLTTDKPVSCVAFDVGYLNNASFSRAFHRRFGTAPSSYRLSGAPMGHPMKQ